jgi:hypothetical protein
MHNRRHQDQPDERRVDHDASVTPTPKMRMNDTCGAISAINAIDNSAAAVIALPVLGLP